MFGRRIRVNVCREDLNKRNENGNQSKSKLNLFNEFPFISVNKYVSLFFCNSKVSNIAISKLSLFGEVSVIFGIIKVEIRVINQAAQFQSKI